MYDNELDALTNHQILQKYRRINSVLNESQIMALCYDENDKSFYLREQCDDWFFHVLTKEDCLDLANMFKEISDTFE